MAAMRSRRGVLGASGRGDSTGSNSNAEIPQGHGHEKLSGKTNPEVAGLVKAARRRRNVELREEIRFTTFDFACLAIDLDSNPKIHGECSRNLPVIQRKEIGSACTLPVVGNSSSHA